MQVDEAAGNKLALVFSRLVKRKKMKIAVDLTGLNFYVKNKKFLLNDLFSFDQQEKKAMRRLNGKKYYLTKFTFK
jgi:hypothetical protein